MEKDTFLTHPFQQKIMKPWGEEIIYTPEDFPYAGKILHVKSGKRLSLQYHNEKKETLCLFSGNALLWIGNAKGEMEKISMEPFHGYSVMPGQQHRIEAVEDCFILESSTPEAGDTVRVEDDYGRPDETEEMRKQERHQN